MARLFWGLRMAPSQASPPAPSLPRPRCALRLTRLASSRISQSDPLIVFRFLINPHLFSNKSLEFSVVISPRSSWAFNNGPEGNYAHVSWKTGGAPKGVTVDSNVGSYEVWTKTSHSATDLELFWRTQLCVFSCCTSYPKISFP